MTLVCPSLVSVGGMLAHSSNHGVCRSLEVGSCRRGGAERQSKAGVTGESLAGAEPLPHGGTRARLDKTCWVAAQLHPPLSLRGFEATLEELHELTRPVLWVLAAPAFTCAPRGLPAPSPSRSAPPPSPGCRGRSPPLSHRGAKAFVLQTTVNQGRLLPGRLCGPLAQYGSGPPAWGEAIAGCAAACPSVGTGSGKSQLLSFKCFGVFSGKRLDSQSLSFAGFI